MTPKALTPSTKNRGKPFYTSNLRTENALKASQHHVDGGESRGLQLRYDDLTMTTLARNFYMRLLLVFALLLPTTLLRAADDAPPVKVTIDFSETPELKDWAEKAKGLVETWHPKIAERLASEGYTPPGEVTIIFKKNMRGVAGTSGNKISVSAKWVTEHPDDFGMIIHEHTHVVQSYPKYDPVWLVEGVADFIRYHVMEPENAPRFDARRQRHTDGYGVTAAMLAFAEEKYDKELVTKLSAAMRQNKYKEELWKEYTGKTPDELWKEFVESRNAR